MTDFQCLEEFDILIEHGDEFTSEFLMWFPANVHVWRAFVAEVLKVRAMGYAHYSSRTIVHVLRHHSTVAEVGGPWKINNNYSPYLSRLFDYRFPHMAGMWSYRGTPAAQGI